VKIPITPYGRRELLLLALAVLAAAVLTGWLWPGARPVPQLAVAVLLAGAVMFFRDPSRAIPAEPGVLLAPADGKITDITEVNQPEFLDSPARRIGIFLSVLDVHINRSPCTANVSYLQDHPGKCLNAMRHRAASEQNHANSVGLDCPDHPAGKVLVKQITGAIARRIVCTSQVGDTLSAGERFGMIKFGSRTELFFPVSQRAQVLVQPGDIVRAGQTIMVRYRKNVSGETS